MPEQRMYWDPEFRAGAVRIVRQNPHRPRAEIARELGVQPNTLTNWVRKDEIERGERPGGLSGEERAELARLRRQVKELEMERDVLKRSVVLWVREATQ